MNPTNKILCVLLMLSVLAVGSYAVYISHIYVSITWSIGNAPETSQTMIAASQLQDMNAVKAVIKVGKK